MNAFRLARTESTGRWDGVFATLTTVIALLALAKQFLPEEWVRLVRSFCHKLTDWLNPYTIYVIPEFSSDSSAVEQTYEKAKQYLSRRGSSSAHRLVVSRAKNTTAPTFTLVSI